MTITPPPPLDLSEVGADWPDEVVDLTDRRRLLVRTLFGVRLTPAQADAVFCRRTGHSSSTTMRSAGRSSSTDDR